MKNFHFWLPLVAAIHLSGCAEDETVSLRCEGQDIQITSIYDGATGDRFTVESLELTDRCLTVAVSHQGCSVDSWTMDLVTDGEYAGTSPTETYATLYLDDKLEKTDVTCAVQASKSFTFDLSAYLRDEVLPANFTVRGAAVYAVDSVLLVE